MDYLRTFSKAKSCSKGSCVWFGWYVSILTNGKSHKVFCFPEAAIFIQKMAWVNFSGLGNSLQSYKTEDSNGNTVVPWNQEREMEWHVIILIFGS